MGKVRLLERNFDLKPYLRRYAHEERHPAWFLSSYTPPDKIHNISKWMEKQMDKGALV